MYKVQAAADARQAEIERLGGSKKLTHTGSGVPGKSAIRIDGEFVDPSEAESGAPVSLHLTYHLTGVPEEGVHVQEQVSITGPSGFQLPLPAKARDVDPENSTFQSDRVGRFSKAGDYLWHYTLSVPDYESESGELPFTVKKRTSSTLTGTWTSNAGLTFNLTQQGDEVTGTYSGKFGGMDIQNAALEGKVDGDSFNGGFSHTLYEPSTDADAQPTKIKVRGRFQCTVADANTIRGRWTDDSKTWSEDMTFTRQ